MNLHFLHNNQPGALELANVLQAFPSTENHVQIFEKVLIRWGNSLGNDENCIVFNPKKAIMQSINGDYMKEIFRINGIRYPNIIHIPISKEINHVFNEIEHHYFVHLVNWNVISLYKSKEFIPNDSVEIPCELNKETRRVCHIARRALYSLGLDFGLIHIVVEKGGRIAVYEVDSAPPLSPSLVNKYAINLKQLIELQYKIKILDNVNIDKNITIGADPEFMLRDRITHEMVPASRLFPIDGPVGCDNRSLSRNRRIYPLGEIRPTPSEHPIQLFENIRNNLLYALNLCKGHNLEWLAGSEPFPGFQIGGHIHFGNLYPSKRLIKALDNYLAIPVFLLENPHYAKKRRKVYGFLSDYRLKEYGFEYRTLSSWLVSPKICKGILTLAYLVAHNYHKLNKDYFNDLKLQNSFYNGNKKPFYSIFKSIWKDIQNLKEYREYQAELMVISSMIINGKRWVEGTDFCKSWNLIQLQLNKGKQSINEGKHFNVDDEVNGLL